MIRTISKILHRRAWLGWSLAAVVLAACGRDEVKTYRVAKETDAPATGTPAAAESAQPTVAWTTPAGWEELPPGEMRVGSFSVKADGQKAEVSIIPLPGLAGGDLGNVNRWRGQVGLPAVKEEEMAPLAEKVEVAGESAQLFDQAGVNPTDNEKSRILAVIQRRDSVAWFYKMTGSDALVAQQKPAFIAFLKSIRFQTASEQPALPPSHPPIGGMGGGMGSGLVTAPADNVAKPDWKLPSGWKESTPGPMQLAKFVADGEGGAKAETSVAMIPGDGGGALANVNRWRKQIGLGPIEAADLEKQTSNLEVGATKAMVLDATSSDKAKRLIAASVPRGDGTWFYKLMGDEAVVAREKEAFLKFVQSAK